MSKIAQETSYMRGGQGPQDCRATEKKVTKFIEVVLSTHAPAALCSVKEPPVW
jgi:hypothetical protein